MAEKRLKQRSATLSLRIALAAGRQEAQQAYFFLRWSLFLFAFLIPLETVDPFGFGVIFSITKIAGFLFATIALFQVRLSLAFPPRALFWFVGYMGASLFVGILQGSKYEELVNQQILTLGLNLVMFWMCYNLMREDRCARWALIGLSIGCIFVSFLMLAGIGQTMVKDFQGWRISGLRQNPNVFAFTMSMGLLAFLGMALRRIKVNAKWALLVIPVCLLMTYWIINSGSRAGMLCLGVGILILLFGKGQWGAKLKVALVVVVILLGIVPQFFSSETSVSRWQSTIEDIEVAGHEKIIIESFFMFVEKPFFGWGPGTHLEVLSYQTGSIYELLDTHNDLLWALTSTGLLGTIPFAIGIGLCVWGAWRARNSIQGYLPLAIVLALLVMSMSCTVQNRKVTWMLLAYAAASATYAARPTTMRTPPFRRNGP